MAGRLAGKVAIITGASGGIGEATALRFAEEGARVMLCATTVTKVEALAGQLRKAGADVVAQQVDVTDESQVRQLVQATADRWGRLDILVNNAGIAGGADVVGTTIADWTRIIDVNLKGPFLCCKYAVAAMLEGGGGAVVNVTSMSATCGIPGQAAYGSSKGGVLQLTRQMAIEYAQRNIRVNAVAPGTIDTPMLHNVLTAQADPDALMGFLIKNHPVGRIGQPVEVANAIVFLASDEASFITGANLAVDGGYTAQ
jgi:NAD(P)-dependent dehydrogenase (short-subunit alcohol dehydrogenase family)